MPYKIYVYFESNVSLMMVYDYFLFKIMFACYEGHKPYMLSLLHVKANHILIFTTKHINVSGYCNIIMFLNHGTAIMRTTKSLSVFNVSCQNINQI